MYLLNTVHAASNVDLATWVASMYVFPFALALLLILIKIFVLAEIDFGECGLP